MPVAPPVMSATWPSRRPARKTVWSMRPKLERRRRSNRNLGVHDRVEVQGELSYGEEGVSMVWGHSMFGDPGKVCRGGVADIFLPAINRVAHGERVHHA